MARPSMLTSLSVPFFSIYRRVTPVGTPVTEEDFLQPGNKQVAAGYVVYGSSTMLVYTTGCGVHAFTYDPSLGVFCLCQERMRFPEKGKTYSINEGNYIKFRTGEEIHSNSAGKKISPQSPVYLTLYRFTGRGFPP